MTDQIAHRPTPLASGITVLFAALAVGSLTQAPSQQHLVVGTVAAIGLLLSGPHIGRYSTIIYQVLLQCAGIGILLLVAASGIVSLELFIERPELFFGICGVLLFGAGLYPVRRRGARVSVAAGLAALLLGILFAGVFQTSSIPILLGATLSAVLAWDNANHGITLGEQLRTDARTYPVELVHASVGLGYGGVLVGIGLFIADYEITFPLPALVLLLVASLVLMIALYRR